MTAAKLATPFAWNGKAKACVETLWHALRAASDREAS